LARYPALDGLRGVAAIVVLLFHTAGLRGGFLGVDIFFVLSGFLITSLLADELERTGRIDHGRFYLGRALRLYPALAVYLAAQTIVIPYFWPDTDSLRNALLAGLFLTDLSMPLWGEPPGIGIGHTWSLSIEFHFYLIWPAVLPFILHARSWRTQVLSLSSLYALATGWRFVRMFYFGYVDAYFSFDTRLSGLVLGALAAILATRYANDHRIQRLAPWFAAAIAGVVLTATQGRITLSLPMAVLELATAGLILAVLNGDGIVRRVLCSRFLVFTGMISYALYLWHMLLVLTLPSAGWYGRLLLTFAASYGIATLSWYCIEARALAFRHRLRSREPAPQAT
jgi:peptidoglycan/LPS O-acetylase OafA/YrhL